ncbi:MAG: winged helix-turn-helix domain-containing protein [Candidatus Hermodarchaeota archaeon]
MSKKITNAQIQQSSIPEEKKITDHSAVSVLFHEKKQEILKLLIEKDMNINELKNAIKLNPGTIKRHIDDLIEKELIFLSQIVKNEYGFTLKYYRATAKHFTVILDWP